MFDVTRRQSLVAELANGSILLANSILAARAPHSYPAPTRQDADTHYAARMSGDPSTGSSSALLISLRVMGPRSDEGPYPARAW